MCSGDLTNPKAKANGDEDPDSELDDRCNHADVNERGDEGDGDRPGSLKPHDAEIVERPSKGVKPDREEEEQIGHASSVAFVPSNYSPKSGEVSNMGA